MVTAKPTYEKWLSEWSDIHDHLQRLHDCAKGNVFEIGVRGGVSTSALLAGLEEHGGRLLSIDIDDSCRQLFKGHKQWLFGCLDSINDAKRIMYVLPQHLDLLFIDGDHSHLAVLTDLRNYGSRADRILLHDTEAPDWPGVRQAVEEYVRQVRRHVTWHTGSYGMAEITR